MSFFYGFILFFYSKIRKNKTLHRITYALASICVAGLSKLRRFHTLRDDPLELRFKYVAGLAEPETRSIFKKLIRRGMTVLDLGANVGYHTVLFSQLVGPNGRVFAFEPNPKTLEILNRNVKNRPNVVVVPFGAADEVKTVKFYDCLLASTHSSVFYDHDHAEMLAKNKGDETLSPRIIKGLPFVTHSVKLVPVDTFLKQYNIDSVDFIKMDIEGCELAALKGMEKTLRSETVTLIMEISPRLLKLAGHGSNKMYSTLRHHFEYIRVIWDKNSIEIIDSETKYSEIYSRLERDDEVVNVLCSKTPKDFCLKETLR